MLPSDRDAVLVCQFLPANPNNKPEMKKKSVVMSDCEDEMIIPSEWCRALQNEVFNL
jgi:hypothetical protein